MSTDDMTIADLAPSGRVLTREHHDYSLTPEQWAVLKTPLKLGAHRYCATLRSRIGATITMVVERDVGEEADVILYMQRQAQMVYGSIGPWTVESVTEITEIPED